MRVWVPGEMGLWWEQWLERVVQRQFTNWPLWMRGLYRGPPCQVQRLLPTWKQGRFRMLSGGEAKLHPPRGTRAVGTPLTSGTEAYSLTKLPLLPKRKTKITRPGVDYNLFFFFKERACIHPLRKESQGYKQNENLSSLGASADCLQEIRSWEVPHASHGVGGRG